MDQRNRLDFDSYLSRFTVRVESNGGIGTGIVVTNDGIVVTCHHVIGNNTSIYDNIRVSLYDNKSYSASILLSNMESDSKLVCDSLYDIAFLKINKPVYSFDRDKSAICPLSELVISGHDFYTSGHRKPDDFGSLGSFGQIVKKTTVEGKGIPIIQLLCETIDVGMSGAPVFDLQSKKVIGIIKEIYDNEIDRDKNLVLAIPIESIVRFYPTLKMKNPSLMLFNRFLEENRVSGLHNSSIYESFQDTYVPPKNYPGIKKKLEQKNCVFIIGPPEYGKTFTAISLMFEYWRDKNKNCYYPEKVDEQNDILKRLKGKKEDLQNSIVYIEDPLGQTESDYESQSRSTIFQDSIMDSILNLKELQSYVIVTMREEIYLRTRSLIRGYEQVPNYVEKLIMGSPSYDQKLRKEILFTYGNKYKCKWVEYDAANLVVLNELDKGKLPTPLNIYSFAYETGIYGDSKDVIEESKLIEIIERLSKRTSETFAITIKKITDNYKMLLLCFPFIHDEFSRRYVQNSFLRVLYTRNLNYHPFSSSTELFEMATNYFQDKINSGDENVKYINPSYSEALPILLSDIESEGAKRFSYILADVLNDLSLDPLNSYIVSDFIFKNLALLRNEERNILYKLGENQQTRKGVILAFLRNITNVKDERVREGLFRIMDKLDDQTYNSLIYDILRNLQDLRDERTRSNLFNYLERHPSILYPHFEFLNATKYIVENLHKINDKKVNERLLTLMDKNERAAQEITDYLAHYLHNISDERVRGKFFEVMNNNDRIASSVMNCLTKNVYSIKDGKVIDKFVELLDKYPYWIRDAAPSIADSPQMVEKKRIREKLLEWMDNDEMAGLVVVNLPFTLDNIKDQKIRKKFFELIEKNPQFAASTGSKIAEYYSDVRDAEIRNKFIELMGRPNLINVPVVSSIIDNLNKIDDERVSYKLIQLLDNDVHIPKPITDSLVYNLHNIRDQKIRKKFFELIDKNDHVTRNVIDTIDHNIDRIEDKQLLTVFFELLDERDIRFSTDTAQHIANELHSLKSRRIEETLLNWVNKNSNSDILMLLDTLASTFNKISDEKFRNEVFRLIDKNDVIATSLIPRIVNYSTGNLEKKLLDKLLGLLDKDEKIANRDVYVLIYNLYKINDEKVRDKVLELLDKIHSLSPNSIIDSLVYDLYMKNDEKVRDKVLEWMDKDVSEVVCALAYKLHMIEDEKIRDKFFELIHMPKIAKSFVDYIAKDIGNGYDSGIKDEEVWERFIVLLDEYPRIAKSMVKLITNRQYTKNFVDVKCDRLLDKILRLMDTDTEIAKKAAFNISWSLNEVKDSRVRDKFVEWVNKDERIAKYVSNNISYSGLAQGLAKKLHKSHYDAATDRLLTLLPSGQSPYSTFDNDMFIVSYIINNYYDIKPEIFDELLNIKNIKKTLVRNVNLLPDSLREKLYS
jgi:Trypsin-like peptidase domain